MNDSLDSLSRTAASLALMGIWVAIVGGVLSVVHWVLTLPMRRAQRARLFLDVIETALKNGLPLEESLISIARSGDLSMGIRFHLLTAWLEQGLRLGDALAKVPSFLPPQITAMLLAGQNMGDFRKVLPACRQMLKDAVSQTRGAISYLVILSFVITPAGLFVSWVLQVIVLPKFKEMAFSMGGDPAPMVFFLHQHKTAMILLQCSMLLLLWAAAFIYIGGPRVVSWFPILERVQYRLPWRRKRMQRDFSTMLAILLDAGVSESESVTLAARCSANRLFCRRAARAVEALRQGIKLPQAVQTMDDSGEFGWRLANACHQSSGFFQALAGWHEWLDAKAFQQEQAAAHVVTTGLVFWSGLFVGAVVISVFMFLTSLINQGILW